MKLSGSWGSSIVLGIAAAFAVPVAAATDDGRGHGKIVTVAFGAGLNTAQPGNPQNHHILPKTIQVNVGDVVNFVVAGLHVIRVYDRGVRLRDVLDAIPDECEVNPPLPTDPFPEACFFGRPLAVPVVPPLDLPVYYEGLDPLAEPPPVPPFVAFSTAQNRVESVSFLKPGRFLVICAVLPHLNDRMIAWVEVRPPGANHGNGAHH